MLWRGNIVTTVGHLYGVLNSPELDGARKKEFSLTNAIMWGLDTGEKMIDFFGIGLKHSLYENWYANPDIYTWVTQNGIVQPKNKISEETCEKGSIIIGEEGRYRRRKKSSLGYLNNPPEIKGLKCNGFEDFSTPKGRCTLAKLMKEWGSGLV